MTEWQPIETSPKEDWVMDKSKFYWRAMPLGDWHIHYGKSMCLVAEGPAWTQYFGFNLYQRIMNGDVKMSAFGYGKKKTENK